jgi:hypothetical protein
MRGFLMTLSLVFLSAIFMSLNASALTNQVGASYQCYDGSAATLTLGTSACLSDYGSAYLNSKASQLCSKACSALSGKCGVNSYRVEYGSCNNVVDYRYSGFRASCYDGYTFTFYGCASATDLRARASTVCSTHTGGLYAKTGVNSFAVLSRCN